MKSPLGIITGIDLILLVGWTIYCRSQSPVARSFDEAMLFAIPMAKGIGVLLFLNSLGALMASRDKTRFAFTVSLLVVSLIGFGLCSLAG